MKFSGTFKKRPTALRPRTSPEPRQLRGARSSALEARNRQPPCAFRRRLPLHKLLDRNSGHPVSPSTQAKCTIRALRARSGSISHRRAAGCTNYKSPKVLEPLLRFLRTLGAVPVPPALEPTGVEAVLERYRTYLKVERGLASSTTRYYIDLVRPFVKGREKASGIHLSGLTSRDVTNFVLAECRNRRRGSAKLMVTALRSLLSFLQMEGELTQPLATAVPSVATWRLAGLPRSLEPAQVRELLASCDRRRATGRRDFAS